ncbi:MAG: DMT family transporter [Alphaproteobacteria bacterium]|nr:DMT family transporter [Alphaproteobacteria bacterium]
MHATDADRGDTQNLAIAAIVVTVLVLSLGDALIKTLSAELILWQIFVLRSCLALPVLLLVLRFRFPQVALMPKVPGWTLARSLMLVLMWIIYYAALPHMPLSIAAAAYYTLPLFITLFSALLAGERVSPSGWGAVALGFCGVVLILKPAASAFNLYALLPLGAAMLYALAMIVTRTKCRDEHPLVLAGALNASFIVAGVAATGSLSLLAVDSSLPPFLAGAWGALGRSEMMAIGLLAIGILVASIGTAFAYQNGRSSIIATFDFAYVGFAVVWGFAFFAEVPDLISVGGMAMIVAAGIISVTR